MLVFADAGVDELAAHLQLIPRQQAVDDDRCVVGRFVVEIAAAAVQHRDRGDLDLDRGDAADRGRSVLDIVVEVVGVAFDGEHGIVGAADVDRGRVEDEVLIRAGDQIVVKRAEEDDALVRGNRSVVGNICELRVVGLVAAAVVLLDNGLELYQLGRDVQARVLYIDVERSDAVRQHIVVGLEVGDRHGERIAVLADIDRVAVDGIGELVGRVVGVQHISVGIGHGQRSVEQVGGCIGLCAVIDAEDVLHRVDERRLLNDDLGDDERADVQRRGLQDIVAVCRNERDRGLVFALVPDGLRPSEQIGQRQAVVVGEHSGDLAVAVESRAARCGAGDVHCRTRERRLGIVVVVAVLHLSFVGARPAPFVARTIGDQECEVVQSELVGRDRGIGAVEADGTAVVIATDVCGDCRSVRKPLFDHREVGRVAVRVADEHDLVRRDGRARSAAVDGAEEHHVAVVGGEPLFALILAGERTSDQEPFGRFFRRGGVGEHGGVRHLVGAVIDLGHADPADPGRQDRRVEVVIVRADAEHDRALRRVDFEPGVRAGLVLKQQAYVVLPCVARRAGKPVGRLQIAVLVRNELVEIEHVLGKHGGIVQHLDRGIGVADIVQRRQIELRAVVDVRLRVVVGQRFDDGLSILVLADPHHRVVTVEIGRDRDGGADPIGDPDVDAVVVAAHCAVELVVAHRLLERVDGVVVVGGI